MSTEAVTPHDLTAERALLGAVLVEPARLTEVVDSGVTPADMWRAGHQRILTAMLDVAAAGDPIDLITLTARLRERGELADAGGPAYIAGLTEGVPRSMHVSAYAAIVLARARDRATERALTEALATLRTRGATEALEALYARVDRGRTRDPYLTRLADEIDRERARREARRHLDAESRAQTPALDISTLRARLGRPRTAAQYLIDSWQPAGSRVMLVAAAKSGKTTMVGGLVRSLVDGDPWLGRYPVRPIDGAVGLLDTEMSPRQMDDWLAAQQIRCDDRVLVVPLRGAVSTLDLLDPVTRGQWAESLRAAGVRYLVLDCLRPVLDALGLDEHRDAGRLLVALDALLAEASIPDAMVVHHMGHSAERARGDSRLVDWPDVSWRLVRPDDDPTGARYVTAYGRDVDIAESRLSYDAMTRRLTIDGGSRREAVAQDALAAVTEVLRDAMAPMSGRAITAALADTGLPRAAVRDALTCGVRDGRLLSSSGPRNAVLYGLPGQCAGVRHD